ncbi:MAG TPA: hypothetical protein VEY33_11685 [Gemmatimonadota bacterium]|nr:hypothetical protein [Gemmatimonadota bacterium]
MKLLSIAWIAVALFAVPARAQDARLALPTATYALAPAGQEALIDIDRPDLDVERSCTRALRGAVIGGLAGAGLGLVMTSNWEGRWNVIVATPLAMLGAGTGALIGSKRSADCGET